MQILPGQPQPPLCHCWNPPKLCRIPLRKQFPPFSTGVLWLAMLPLTPHSCFRPGGLCRPRNLQKDLWQPLWLL